MCVSVEPHTKRKSRFQSRLEQFMRKNNHLSVFYRFLFFFFVHLNIVFYFKERPTQRHQHFWDFPDFGLNLASGFVFVCWCFVDDHLQVFADFKQKMGCCTPELVLTEKKPDHFGEFCWGLFKIIRIYLKKIFPQLCLWRISSEHTPNPHSQICTSVLLSLFLPLLLMHVKLKASN